MNHHLHNSKLSCINSKTWRKLSSKLIYIPENKKYILVPENTWNYEMTDKQDFQLMLSDTPTQYPWSMQIIL